MTWGVSNYSTNPALNTAINGVDISEYCSASGYNDALRQMMADIAAWTASNGVTYPISIANGGTGQTTAAAGLAALGGLSSSYQRLPQVAKSAGFTLDLTMDGGHVRYTGTAATATIPTNATVAFSLGSIITIINDGSGVLTIAPAAGPTLVWTANNGTGSRSLAIGGVASLIQVATDRWFISGAGLS